MTDQRWPLSQAEAVAHELVKLLEPACERITVAGSVRRRMAAVGDIELLCIPKPAEWYMDALESKLWVLMKDKVLTKRPNKIGQFAYGKLNKLMVHVPTGIGVDIFSTTKENFGMAFVVRTGSASFVKRIMGRFIARNMRGHAYAGVTINNTKVPCPDEETVFRLLGLAWIPPERRE